MFVIFLVYVVSLSNYFFCPPALCDIYPTTTTWYSLFVLKVPLNTKQTNKQNSANPRPKSVYNFFGLVHCLIVLLHVCLALHNIFHTPTSHDIASYWKCHWTPINQPAVRWPMAVGSNFGSWWNCQQQFAVVWTRCWSCGLGPADRSDKPSHSTSCWWWTNSNRACRGNNDSQPSVFCYLRCLNFTHIHKCLIEWYLHIFRRIVVVFGGLRMFLSQMDWFWLTQCSA